MGRRPLLGVLFWSGRVIAELPIIDNVRIEVNVVSVRVVHREAHQQINRSRQQINLCVLLLLLLLILIVYTPSILSVESNDGGLY